MTFPAVVHSLRAGLCQVWPVIVLEELGSSLFDTALQMVVLDRSATDPDSHSQQIAMTNFYMIYNLIVKFTPILPALFLARLGDRGWRRLPVIVPLVGYLVSRLALMLVVIFGLPIEVMYGAGALFGLSGGYAAYWPGVMTLASLASTASKRSKTLMLVELLYGIAGLVGSLVSGHLFQLYTASLGHGIILLIISTIVGVLCLLHATLLLQVTDVSNREEEDESCGLIPPSVHSEPPIQKNLPNIILLFISAILYSSAVGGAINVLGAFVMKEPLSWDAKQVGYGNAAGCLIFITSYLGLIVLRRYFSETSVIMIGMLSFTSGIYFMSFVTTTYFFYLARSLNLLALIPMPTIRSLLSQQVPKSSCGMTLTALQVFLKFGAAAYIPASTKIYQSTLDWFPGFVFTLSSACSVLAMIPISIVGCRTQNLQYETIQGD
ncbi:thymic stromal cotransporter homolog [Boleophthalmus pectinirostris]|uniref:thymic stromal cotransporter homolog n=1 Tax=Boleophthalmus pectinirostris TaxID=150288 RepID=UPI00243144DB|nr:thymic stromal cotransporter homolog [Boleophthalmus pectinirostris]